jgi:glycine/D-amino acid oxidase-like deaminating enzyme
MRWGSNRSMDFDFAPRIWRSLESHLKRMFPSLSDVKVAYRWSGPVSFNVDMAPEIGYCGDDRIICWTGCFGQGLALTHINEVIYYEKSCNF